MALIKRGLAVVLPSAMTLGRAWMQLPLFDLGQVLDQPRRLVGQQVKAQVGVQARGSPGSDCNLHNVSPFVVAYQRSAGSCSFAHA